MDFGLFNIIMSKVDFGTVTLAILGVFGMFIVVLVSQKGAAMVVKAVAGDRVFYAGRFWDKDVYDSAMSNVTLYRKAGGSLDKETRQRHTAWKNARARDGLF